MPEFKLNFGALVGLHGSITTSLGRNNLDMQVEILLLNFLEMSDVGLKLHFNINLFALHCLC